MKHLRSLNPFFYKYRYRLGLGILFIIISNYFAILAPQVTGYVFDVVTRSFGVNNANEKPANYDILVNWFIGFAESYKTISVIALCGITILVLALIRGIFMFFMRQTIIVMSRHIEFDQKNQIFRHYLKLDANFYKTHSTGDLMNRVAEDVSRVRMFTGPAVMYSINLVTLIGLAVFYMVKRDPLLTLYVLAPLPILAFTIYKVNTIINRRSEKIQSLLSDLTTNAQESYSGIRVIKSFVQEKAMNGFFEKNSEEYKKNAIGLAGVEAIYFPSMSLIIGLSTLLTIMIGGIYAIQGTHGSVSVIAEFVIYINMLTFPVGAIGWTASMIQRAIASQKRINEFLHTEPEIANPPAPATPALQGNIAFHNIEFIYPNTGIHALKQFDLSIRQGQKIAIIGHTGSGKTTIAHLLLRMYDPNSGHITIDGVDLRKMDMQSLRQQISYVPQDVFLFSDSISNNILFGTKGMGQEQVQQAARQASVEKEILGFHEKYDTMIGERGVTLSGGQKQRISIARALVKDPQIVVFDDCLSAVDARTEKEILGNLYRYLQHKTAIIITHRIFTLFDFDHIVVLEEGRIVEMGTHKELLSRNGYYSYLYEQQQQQERQQESISDDDKP